MPPIGAPSPPAQPAPESQGKVLNNHYLRFAEHCFFDKATQEVKKFTPEKTYKDNTVERYWILYYTSRIMDCQQIRTVDNFINLDLLCFMKPVVDQYSPWRTPSYCMPTLCAVTTG